MKYTDIHRVTLVEFEEFRRFSQKHLNAEEYEALTFFLSAEPEAGVVISGTGGIRKLRWAAKGKGKSGGVRVIYYYHDPNMPLLLLTGFAKNEMENISPAAKNLYRRLMPQLVESYRRNRHDKKGS